MRTVWEGSRLVGGWERARPRRRARLRVGMEPQRRWRMRTRRCLRSSRPLCWPRPTQITTRFCQASPACLVLLQSQRPGRPLSPYLGLRVALIPAERCGGRRAWAEWVLGGARRCSALCRSPMRVLRTCCLCRHAWASTSARAGAHAGVHAPSVPTSRVCHARGRSARLPACHGQAGGRRRPSRTISVDAWIAARARKSAIEKEKEARRAVREARAAAKLKRRQEVAVRVEAVRARRATERAERQAAKEARARHVAEARAKRERMWTQRANQRLALYLDREARMRTIAQSSSKSGCVAVDTSGTVRIDLAALAAKNAAESRVVRVRLRGAGVVKRTKRRIAAVTLQLRGVHLLHARC